MSITIGVDAETATDDDWIDKRAEIEPTAAPMSAPATRASATATPAAVNTPAAIPASAYTGVTGLARPTWLCRGGRLGCSFLVWSFGVVAFAVVENREVVEKRCEQQVFRLFGYAGTGKTTILRALVEILKAKKVRVHLAAPGLPLLPPGAAGG